MKRIAFAVLVLILLAAVGVRAQGVAYQNMVLNRMGQPVGAATVAVCAASATGVPCSPTITIYSNQALTTAIASPQTDSLGNFTFYLAPGDYQYCITAGAITTTCYKFSLPCIPSTTCGGITSLPVGVAQGGTGATTLAGANIPVQAGTITTGDCVKWASGTSVADSGTTGCVGLQVATPAAPTVTVNGTAGTTTYTYFVVAHDNTGGSTLVSASGSTTTGNATLSATNFNAVTWTAVTGAASYDVLKTNTATSLGLNLACCSVNDTGQATAAYTAPTSNTTAYATQTQPPMANGRYLAREPATSDTIRYVSKNGSDSNDCLSWGTACATIAGAATSLGANGGVINAYGLGATQTVASNPFSGITAPITLLTGPTTLTTSAKWTYPSNFKWYGKGTTLKQNFASDYLMESADLTNGTDDVEIAGVTFNGNSAATGFALLHHRGKRGKFHNNTFTDTRALGANTTNGIRLDGVAAGVAANDNEIRNNVFNSVAWIAVTIAANANNNRVEDNTFVNCFSQIDINGDAADSSGNRFEGNIIDGGQGNSFLQSVTGTSVQNNTFTGLGGTSGWALTVLLASGTAQKKTVLSGNQIIGGAGGGFQIENNVSYFAINDNMFFGNGLDGILFNLSSGNTTRGEISNNVFINNGNQNATAGFSAIRLSGAAGTSVAGILVSGNLTFDDQATPSQTYGISFAGSGTFSNWTVIGNDFSNNKTAAFQFAVTPSNSQFGPNREDATGTPVYRAPTATSASSLVAASQLPLSGSVAGSVTSVAGSACGLEFTATVTGATTSMTAVSSPDANPGSLVWRTRVSAANTVAIAYCNPTTAAIVPAAATFQIRVIQ